MTAVVVGIGQAAAGDDGVGLEVARVLATRGLDVRACADASVVLALLAEGRRVVIVDAVVGGAPGHVRTVAPDQLADGPAPLSSHGLGVAEALALAGTLYGAPDVTIVAVGIAAPTATRGLSPAVAAAVAPAADLAARLAAGDIDA